MKRKITYFGAFFAYRLLWPHNASSCNSCLHPSVRL